MPIYMIIPRYSRNYSLFYQLLDSNLFTHRNTYAILREATSETYGPRVYFPSYLSLVNKLFLAPFILLYLLSIYIIKIPKIFILLLLSLLDLTLASGHEGIDNPFYRVGCEVLICLCRYEVTRVWSPTGLITWFSKTEGNTYAALLHHPFLFKGKPTQCSRGSTCHLSFRPYK